MKKIVKHITQVAFAIMLLINSSPLFAQTYIDSQTKSPKLIIKLMYKNGSVSDPKGKEGLTYLTTQLLTNTGTKDLTYAQIQQKLYPMAGYYYGTTDKEVSILTFAVPAEKADEFYPILRGLLLNPSFAPEDFERVKSNQQNYVDQVIRASSDEEYSKKALEDLLFRGTPYQHMVQGKSESVKKITLTDVKNHYNKMFGLNTLTMVGLSGNYTNPFLTRMIEDFKKIHKGDYSTKTQSLKPKAPEGIQVEIISKENALGSAIFAGFPMEVTRAKLDQFAALMVANSYLGEHRQSEGLLFQKMRTARSMNYGNYTYIEWFNNGGSNFTPPPGTPRTSNYFGLWIRPVQIAEGLKKQYPELKDIKTGHAHFALRMAIREIDNLVKNGMKQEDFELIRNYLRGYTKLYAQTPEQQLSFRLDSHFYDPNSNYIKNLDEQLAKLTLADVNAAIRKHWQTQNMYVSIVTDDSEAEPLAESLRSNAPSPMSYSNAVREGLPKELLAEDEIVATYPLNVKEVKIIKSEDTFK